MVLLRRKQDEFIGLHYHELDDVRLRVFVSLMDTIKAESERTANEFKAMQTYKNNAEKGDTTVVYSEHRVNELIAELTSFRKHLVWRAKECRT